MTALVVDDSLTTRRAVVEMLRTLPGCVVVGEAVNGQDALEKARVYRPGLIVMDIHMPVMGGFEAMRLLKAELPAVHIVMTSTLVEAETCEEALQGGALACLQKGHDLWSRLPGLVAELSGSQVSGRGNQ